MQSSQCENCHASGEIQGAAAKPTAHLPSLTLDSFFFGITLSCSVWLPRFFFFPLAFVKILGRCLQTLLLCLHPALLARASSLFCFPARPRKTKTQHREPPPAGACASSPLAMAQLLVHTAAKASSPFLPLSPHFTGDRALDAEEGPQLHGLPKSTGSLLTQNGETRFHLVC